MTIKTLLASFAALAATIVLVQGQEVIPVLKTGSRTLSNVVVITSTATHLFVESASGLVSVKLSELSPELQKRFSYDPAQAEAIANANRVYASAAPASTNRLFYARIGADGGTNLMNLPPGLTAKEFAIRDAGFLTLAYPKGWRASVQSTPAGEPPSTTISFRREFDEKFVAMVTAVPRDSKLRQYGAQKVLEMTGNHALSRAVEKEVNLKELRGEEARGLFFTLTDKKLVELAEPKPGTYKYLTQGWVDFGDLALSFVIGDNYPHAEERQAALDMISSAHLAAADKER